VNISLKMGMTWFRQGGWIFQLHAEAPLASLKAAKQETQIIILHWQHKPARPTAACPRLQQGRQIAE